MRDVGPVRRIRAAKQKRPRGVRPAHPAEFPEMSEVLHQLCIHSLLVLQHVLWRPRSYRIFHTKPLKGWTTGTRSAGISEESCSRTIDETFRPTENEEIVEKTGHESAAA